MRLSKKQISSKKKLTLRHKIYMFIIIAGLVNIFFPYTVHADLFGFEVQDVYTQITSNVKETNDILKKAFEFSQISPYDVVNSISGTAQGNIAVAIRNASKSMALVVAALLLMVDFFRKSINFEWASKWENVLIFLIKIIVIKQVVQNSDVIVGHIYSGFQYINNVATGTSPDFLPYGEAKIFTWTDEDGIMTKMVKKGWWEFWYDWGAGEYRDTFSYSISEESVKIFYPNAKFEGTNLNATPFAQPTTMLFMPTLEIVLLQPYFLVMKAIAYIVFVIAIGRVFELSIYTILAPLPLVTFASDTTHDVAKNFIKNYIAAILQISVIVVMFVVYAAVNNYCTNYGFTAIRLMQLVELIALGLGVVKSGAWAKKICGIG